MPTDRTAILFCPPLAPLEVPPGGRVAIGRGKDCELVLITDSASRRHAEVYPEGADFYVRDLGSKNGTYLNGEKLERAHELRPGDRIGVGSCAITFARIEGTLAGFLSDPGGHETVAFSRNPMTEVFRGELAEIPIFVVLQMLEMGRKSGVLEVATDAGPARSVARRGPAGARRDREGARHGCGGRRNRRDPRRVPVPRRRESARALAGRHDDGAPARSEPPAGRVRSLAHRSGGRSSRSSSSGCGSSCRCCCLCSAGGDPSRVATLHSFLRRDRASGSEREASGARTTVAAFTSRPEGRASSCRCSSCSAPPIRPSSFLGRMSRSCFAADGCCATRTSSSPNSLTYE